MDLLTETERRLTTERLLKYQGTAKIDLDQIYLQPLTSREIDQKNVDRLRDIFAKDGCQRLDIRNHVTAIVSRRHLGRACQAAGLTAEELKTCQQQYVHLSFRGHQVQCLHGQHRLKAAEETLPPFDRWWTVDLYLDDISPDLRTALIDEYANEKAPSDGEVYRKIRQYQHEANALFQNRWWTRLSPNKAKRLRQLTSQDNTNLCAAFDALLAIPGLWNGMSLGLLNTVLALKCDEELIHYLTHVKNFWAALVNHDRTRMALIDLYTVDALQLYAPRASKVDRKTVKGKILGGEVFSNFNRSERAAIWKKMRSHEMCDGIIPSLHTFFRDISYLELCANAVKRLILLNKQQLTVRSALVHSFRSRRSNGACLIQTSETSFRRLPGSRDERISSGYRQIWMYAMRHYPDMAKDLQSGPKANPTRAKARAKADESVIHGMATLAKKLGFRTPQIKAILRQSPDQQIARAALLKARKPDDYHYDSETFESLIEQIAGCFALAVPNEAAPVAHITGRAIKLKDRCGVPQAQTQQLDRPHILLGTLHSATLSQTNLSSLEVRRSVYYAFFGKPSPTTLQGASLGQSSFSDPPSPLFIPRDMPRLQSELSYDIMSRSGFDEASFNGYQDRSQTPEEQHQRQGEGMRRGQEIEQAVEHGPLSQDLSIQSFIAPASTVSEVMDMYWDSSDAEDQARLENVEQQPVPSLGMDCDSEEHECTEIDEGDLLNRSERGSPGVEGVATGDQSILGAPIDTDMSSILEERAESVEDRGGMPTTLSRHSSLQPPTSPKKSRGASWKPYDVTQKGNRKVSKRSLATRGQSIAQDAPGFDTLQPIAEHRGREITRPVDEPDGLESISGGSLPAESQNGTAGEQMGHGTELITGAGQELLQEDRLQTPVTELPADLPSLITRLREEERQLENESVHLANNTTQGRPKPRTGVSPSHGTSLGDEDLPRSPRQRLRRSPQLSKSKGVGKLRLKNGPTHRDINRAGTRDAAIADGLWNSDDGDENLTSAAVARPSPQDTERHPANMPDPEQAQREAIERQEEEHLLFDSPHPLEETDYKEMEEDQRQVTITFQVYEQSKWRTTDVVSVSPDHVAEAQILADGYARDPRRNARFYDGQLRRVANAGGSGTDSDQRDLPECERATQPQKAHASYRGAAGAGCDAPSGRGRFSTRDNRTAHEVVVDRSDPSQVERVAKKEARNRQATFYDKNLRVLTPAQCYEAAIEDDTNMVFMHFAGDPEMDEDTIRSIAREVEF
ncbi:hypothetical protein BJX68DRAFT_276174 [Aspergillus pseudodeflectus]|uniref:Uncharacterized protein n=1 Tax=Aspergillus pseudodeflectus TaxID=176178 RepID=A0ABR4K9M9_9EURO